MSLENKFEKTPVYQINLDDDPSKRWIHILTKYKTELIETIPKFKELINNMFGLAIYPARLVINTMKATGKIMYAEEIESIAKFTGMSFDYILLLQICYELNSCCTSVVTKLNGNYVFFRTMDWPLSWLNKLTVDLEFVKNGNVLFKATSWVGYVGIATATLPKKYSIAMNFRLTKDQSLINILGNINMLIGMKWPIGYLIRDVCENDMDYERMLVTLCSSPLVSPCYLTICGIENKPKIITRDPNGYTITKKEYTVQTNCDQWLNEPNILYSVERRTLVTNAIEKEHNYWSSENKLIKKLLVHPVVNEETIYYSIMNPTIGSHESFTLL